MSRADRRRVRRVVTGHDEGGRSRVLVDEAAPNVVVRQQTGGIVSTLLWVTDGAPASLDGHADAADRSMGVPPPVHGTAFRIVEFPPFRPELLGTSAETARADWGMQGHALPGAEPRHPFIHRTRTVDYIVVLEGEIDMLLDEGEVHLQAGDTLVQRGTNHAWINRGDQPCRLVIIFVDAEEPAEISNRPGSA
jgi:mannose-6-phosphate isomerase-like protein (cupin superfamily)